MITLQIFSAPKYFFWTRGMKFDNAVEKFLLKVQKFSAQVPKTFIFFQVFLRLSVLPKCSSGHAECSRDWEHLPKVFCSKNKKNRWETKKASYKFGQLSKTVFCPYGRLKTVFENRNQTAKSFSLKARIKFKFLKIFLWKLFLRTGRNQLENSNFCLNLYLLS